MDNHFVPNLTFGPTMLESLSRCTDVPLDAHLMIYDPDSTAVEYVEAGCGSVTLHVQAARGPGRPARGIRAQGARAAVAPQPAPPGEPHEGLVPQLGELVGDEGEPGFGGPEV